MNSLISFGKYLFIIPMAVFGIIHFTAADQMAGMAPGGAIMVYITGVLLLASVVSVFMGKFDKLATTLLGIMLLLFIIPHAQALSASPGELSNILKNISLAGGAFMYASAFSKDNSYIN